ncbi:hypothetical protein I7I50_07963 [Histoplasma capsulatum G186AR]|uniref:Uncharacterized protein n=1 Tax=Ajellomyces capsulatus TaxID=5037 RepID=A0A8H7YF36_AJECA|nr:hypothetical protein I7I52_08479 [Histoplasma capsulatum]QSS68523.1 hypothetical protein I7I50_07963 [Histoplasma capsulatum G186AR]
MAGQAIIHHHNRPFSGDKTDQKVSNAIFAGNLGLSGDQMPWMRMCTRERLFLFHENGYLCLGPM